MDISTVDSDSEDECTHPSVSISMEYVEKDETFNVYIRRISNCPYLISYRKKFSRAVLYVVCGIQRSTWTGRVRHITSEEIQLNHSTTIFRTLAVERELTTIFNEFFSCQITKDLLRQTLLRVQFCDVNASDEEIVIAECDYWVNNRPIPTFHDFILPLTMASPDLGEIELTLTYLPTAQRLNIERIKLTNLKTNDEVYVKAFLYENQIVREIHESEKKHMIDNQKGTTFKRFFFNLPHNNKWTSVLVIQALHEHSIIGQFGLSDSTSSCDHTVWKKIMAYPTKRFTEAFRLRPAA
ncbi:unnamed protein product [Auanema sp. JU1783]|nr:unnamed protein product [Auanema sp. JU1783]